MNINYIKTKSLWRTFIATMVIAWLVNIFVLNSTHAGWKDFLGELKNQIETSQHAKLSSDEIIEGLKEALRVGTGKAIDILAKPDGFYIDQSVKILMPDELKKVEKLLRNIGQKHLADKFVETMNRAAESSVQSTLDIFVKAIKQMTFKDAMDIYKGQEDEATRYFRKTEGQEVHNTILPIVRDATEKTGVTSTYKEMTRKIHQLHLPLDVNMPDIDKYVTEKTMDGIFHKLAKEEALIRKDPAARTTEILKKVFSQ
jgi:hypothetical protein